MNETLANGLVLMIIGMGTVIMFLYLMTICMNIMSKTILWLNKIFPEVLPAEASNKKAVKSNNDEEIAIAILAARQKKYFN